MKALRPKLCEEIGFEKKVYWITNSQTQFSFHESWVKNNTSCFQENTVKYFPLGKPPGKGPQASPSVPHGLSPSGQIFYGIFLKTWSIIIILYMYIQFRDSLRNELFMQNVKKFTASVQTFTKIQAFTNIYSRYTCISHYIFFLQVFV